MSGQSMTIKAPDGDFTAYVARPTDSGPKGAVVVLQEIFGVNAVMRELTNGLAAQGWLAVCPDLFWRLSPGIELTDGTAEEWKQALDLMGRFNIDKGVDDIRATIDAVRADPECSGRVGAVGYCLGGRLAFLTATRTDVDAAVGYYGVGLENLLGEADAIGKPLMLHIAGEDSFSSKSAQAEVVAGLDDRTEVTLHLYPGRNHAFARPGGEHWHAADAALANQRTADFFKKNIG